MEQQPREYRAIVTVLKPIRLKRKDENGNINPYSKVFKKSTYLVLVGDLIENIQKNNHIRL